MATTFSTRLLVGAAALALVATACSSSDGLDPTAERELEDLSSTTTEPPNTEAPPETAAPTTSTTTVAPPATEATTTIAVVPATEVSTTTVPGSTPDPRDADIAAALQEFNDSWVRCAEASPNCDPAILAGSTAEPQLKVSADIVVAGNTNGETVSNLTSYRTQLQSIEYFTDTTAEVKVCNEDGLIVTGRSGELVTDRFSSAITIWRFELLDGTWKVTTGRELRRVVGEENTLCEFS